MGWRGLVLGVLSISVLGCGFILDGDDDGLNSGKEKDLGLDPKNADTDGDGMLDGDEVDGGTDPLNMDSDADHLLDGDEADNGADPLNPDTDDDGYLDGDEVLEGHNPNDKKDRIYVGRWPYVYDKDSIKGGEGSFVESGKRFKRLQFIDQHGDTVDLFDFYNSDKPVVVDISAEWCPPCNLLAGWLDGQNTAYDDLWPAGPEVIARGDVYWITILGEDNNYVPAYPEVSERWFEAYPTKEIPVLADPAYYSADFVGLGWWPTGVLLDSELKVVDLGPFYVESVLAELNNQFPE